MDKRKVSRLALEIETNRQRLQYATETRDESLKLRTLKLLVQLEASYFDATKHEHRPTKPEDCFLVFSEAYPDGARLTRTQYRALTRTMDKCDRETHQCIPIEGGMEQATDQAIILVHAETADEKYSA